MKYSSIFIIAIFIFFSCKRINPDRPAYSGETLPLPEAKSNINVHLAIPLAYIEKHLDKSLAELIYAEDALNIANGLTTQLEVFRTGSLKLSSNAQNK